MAAKNLLDQIRHTLEEHRGKLYEIFVDYSKAFDMVNRKLLMDRLEELVGRTSTTILYLYQISWHRTTFK